VVTQEANLVLWLYARDANSLRDAALEHALLPLSVDLDRVRTQRALCQLPFWCHTTNHTAAVRVR